MDATDKFRSDDRLYELELENHRLRSEIERISRLAAQSGDSMLSSLLAAEDRLRQRERDLQSILDNMPAMIGYWDCNLRNRFGNHAYRTWFGIDANEMTGMHIREVIGEERYHLNLPYMERALHGEAQTFERTIDLPDGKTIRHSLAHYIPDIVNGEVMGFYAMVSDITSIKETEAALRENQERLRLSEERYRAVLQDQTEIISRFRADGTFVFVNDVYCRFFDKPAATIIDEKWLPVVYPEDIPEITAVRLNEGANR
jgi:PAS domain S-box-containing protein